jgi:catalase
MEFKRTLTTGSEAPVTDNQNSRTAGPRDPESNVRLALTLSQYFLYQYKECLWY